ncbi:MAG: hypothetical protein AAF485_01950, partial [Chloroflexota bacterium]
AGTGIKHNQTIKKGLDELVAHQLIKVQRDDKDQWKMNHYSLDRDYDLGSKNELEANFVSSKNDPINSPGGSKNEPILVQKMNTHEENEEDSKKIEIENIFVDFIRDFGPLSPSQIKKAETWLNSVDLEFLADAIDKTVDIQPDRPFAYLSKVITNGPQASDHIAKIQQLYQDNISVTLSSIIEQEMSEFYDLPVSWWETAILIAVENNARRWSYLQTILERAKQTNIPPQRTVPTQKIAPAGEEMVTSPDEELFNEFKSMAQQVMAPATFNNCFSSMRLIDRPNGTMRVSVSPFAKEWLENRLTRALAPIERTLGIKLEYLTE